LKALCARAMVVISLRTKQAAILEAINKRITTVRKLHAYKAEQGYDAVDPAREDWLTQYLQRCNKGPLSNDEVAILWRSIIDSTLREVARLRDA
jgi:chorismate mutase